ncbi:MAG: restriction endonuclease subunit S [Cyclobacteriaceae bacterium]|nr:restriction endonuclease subunit S [Cyclobacteriaceae bacterium SS2]
MREVELGEVLEYEQPTNYIVESTFYSDDYDVPVLTAGKSFLLGYTNESENVFKDVPVIIFDDFTTAIQYVDFEFKVKSSAMKILKPKKEMADIRYLFHRMSAITFEAEQHKRYWISKYSKIKIPLPPLPIQQKIAEVLDTADRIRRRHEQILKKYDQLAQSVFLEMFGDPVKNEKGWERVKLSKIIIEGPTNGLYKPSKDYSSGCPIIRIDSFYNSWVNTNFLRRVRASSEEIIRYEIKEGDFVINRVNSPSHLGKCGLVPKLNERVVYESNMMRIRFDKSKVSNQYMLYTLSSKALKNQILNASKDAVNQSSINQKDVNNFTVLLPPFEIQNQFTSIIDKIEQQKQQAKAELDKSEELFQSLMQRAFRGELEFRELELN